MGALGFVQDFQTYLKTVATTPPEDETDEKPIGAQERSRVFWSPPNKLSLI